MKRPRKQRNHGIEFRTPYRDGWRSWGWYETAVERDRRLDMIKTAYRSFEFRTVEKTPDAKATQ